MNAGSMQEISSGKHNPGKCGDGLQNITRQMCTLPVEAAVIPSGKGNGRGYRARPKTARGRAGKESGRNSEEPAVPEKCTLLSETEAKFVGEFRWDGGIEQRERI